MTQPLPDFSFELAAFARGALCVAGVDEVGRGPLAGPVTAAAVILDPARIPPGLNDSKKLTHARRVALSAACTLWRMSVLHMRVWPRLMISTFCAPAIWP
jgi:ribonuclease HII